MTPAANILGVRFELAGSNDLFAYSRGFLEAYEAESDLIAHRRINVRVQRAEVANLAGATRAVHRSKHRYWNFSAQVADSRPLRAVWPTRGLQVEADATLSALEVSISPKQSTAAAGESLFHLLRSFALYLRARGNFLHASGVVVDGNALLFVGNALAGKTTLFTAAVRSGRARPLANDRALLTPEPLVHALSWPSYASYCEGTLLEIPELARAACAFEEREPNPLRTQRWSAPLEAAFSVDHKRIYPMIWLSEALHARYVRRAPVGAVVFAHLAPGLNGASLRELRTEPHREREQILGALSAACFDTTEPSFLPWHGLPLPDDAPPLTALVERLALAGARFFSLEMNPNAVSTLFELLEEVRK